MILITQGTSNEVVCSFSEGEVIGNLVVSLEHLLDHFDIGTGFYRVVVERFVEEPAWISKILKNIPSVNIKLTSKVSRETVGEMSKKEYEGISDD